MWMMRWGVVLVVVVTVGVMVAGVGAGVGARRLGRPEATPGASELPMVEAPLGLGAVTLAADEVEIETAMTRLPEEVAGERRAEPFVEEEAGRFRASYGDRAAVFGAALTVQAVDVSTGDFYPAGWRAGEVVALVASGRTEFELDGFGRDGSLVWFRATTSVGLAEAGAGTPESRTLYTVAWGEANRRWLFSVGAFSPEGRDALVEAFIEAARSRYGPRPFSGTPLAGLPGLPVAGAPGGLSGLTFPEGADGLMMMFERLSGRVAGEVGSEVEVLRYEGRPYRYLVSYGDDEPGFVGAPLVVYAVEVAYFQIETTAGEVVRTGREMVLLESIGSENAVPERCGRDGDLSWCDVVFEYHFNLRIDPEDVDRLTGGPRFQRRWAVGDSPWLFGVSASSPEGREALTEAVVAAVEGMVGTPEAAPAD